MGDNGRIYQYGAVMTVFLIGIIIMGTGYYLSTKTNNDKKKTYTATLLNWIGGIIAAIAFIVGFIMVMYFSHNRKA